MMAYLCH